MSLSELAGLQTNPFLGGYASKPEEEASKKEHSKGCLPIEVNYQIYLQYQRNNCICISTCINEAAEKVFYDLQRCFLQTEQSISCWTVLHTLPKKYGSTKTAVSALQNASPLEQMIALNIWFYCGEHSISENQYTFCFSNYSKRLKGRNIPLSIKKGAKSLMEVKLGNRSHEYPALKYDKSTTSMAACDPWKEERTENFVYHLEALEIVRQPNLIGATLIKGNAFESEYIDQDWRYGTAGREACVEIPRQRRLSKKNQMIRAESAAYNLFKLINTNLGDIDLCDHTRNPAVYTTPNNILQAYQAGVEKLYLMMLRLMAAKLGPFSTELQEHVNKALSGDKSLNAT